MSTQTSPGVAYTIATGCLFCPLVDLYSEASRLLGRGVMTHDFADHDVWVELRAALEAELMEAAA